MSRRAQRRGRTPRRRWSLSALAALLVLLSVPVGAGYVLWLDRQVVSQFEGKRWALPARVYARPLELYQGRRLSPDNLQIELNALNYRAGDGVRAGSYRREGNEFRIATRGFRFHDGVEPPRQARVRFAGHRVASLEAGPGVSLLRLEPALIGGIYPSHGEDRVLVRLQDVPEELVQALLAVEDRRFLEHRGISFAGIARAAYANLRAGRVVQGGSTITQQLVKNFYLSGERTFRRKVNEAIMAVLLELRYDKGEILEAYLNEVFLAQDGGRSIHGFGLAAEYYFGSSLDRLELHQLATLAGLVRGPSYYHPRRHPERAQARRNLVLKTMVENGAIDADQAAAAGAKPLDVAQRPSGGGNRYPAFMELVLEHLRRDYRAADLSSEGLQVFTTLVPHVQEAGEAALLRRLQGLADDLQAASVVVNVDDGTVSAVLGSREPRAVGFNRALNARRPVGSLLKPAVYLSALERPRDYGLGTLLTDAPLQVEDAGGRLWEPRNYGGEFHGDVPLWEALANSYNLSTVALGLEIGMRPVVGTMQRLGLRAPRRVYPSLLLGAAEYTPLEIAQMYQTIASGGYRTPLRAVEAVLAEDGERLQRYPLSVERAFDSADIYLLNYGLEQVMRSGTGRSATRVLPDGLTVAGKTGTTDGHRDSWFAGYAGDLLAVVWMGHDDNRTTGLTGASGALPIWSDLMARVHPRPLDMPRPDTVAFAWIDTETGRSAADYCTHAVQLPYKREYLPDEADCVMRERPLRRQLRDWFR